VGNPIDRVVSDFTAGAVEDMLVEVGDDHDLPVVEGQGSIIHPRLLGGHLRHPPRLDG